MPLIDAEPYEFALEPMRAALVIIDMQRDFLEPGGFGQSLGDDVSLLRRTIAPTRRLLDAARAVGLMVIHTREGHRADLADLPPAKKARGRPSLAIAPWAVFSSAASPATTSCRAVSAGGRAGHRRAQSG